MLLGLFFLGLSSCSKTQFGPVNNGSTSEPFENYTSFFKMNSSTVSYEQPQLDSNQTQVSFQVTLPDGTNLPDLRATDFSVFENGNLIQNHTIRSDSVTTKLPVDIVLAIDVTGSMSPTIESAKIRLINFVRKSRSSGVSTRMCLITFGDRTVKKCDRFFDITSTDTSTSSQVDELISEISKLKALTGVDDPGGSDLNENPMRAFIDASKADWKADAQRFLILITDDGFLYSPGNSGSVGALAPKFSEVQNALTQSQMKVFAATPSLAGYNKTFQGLPGIVQVSNGEWFNFNDIISGIITLDTILDRILNRVQTTYLAEYTLDESSGLDPSLPLKKRKIEIVLGNGLRAIVKVESILSNLPEGRKPQQKKFKLTDKKLNKNSLKVKINGLPITSDFTLSSENEIEFSKAPIAKSKIEFVFNYQDLKDSLQTKPIIVRELNLDQNQLRIILNGVAAKEVDLIFARTLEGYLSIQISDHALDELDAYGIRVNEGLNVRVEKK